MRRQLRPVRAVAGAGLHIGNRPRVILLSCAKHLMIRANAERIGLNRGRR
jgi:hypothetical protein